MVVSMVGIFLSYEERFMSAAKTPPSVIGQVRGIFPKLGELTDKGVFGDVWERKRLSKRDRSLVTTTSLITQGATDQLRGHLWRLLANGLTRGESTGGAPHL